MSTHPQRLAGVSCARILTLGLLACLTLGGTSVHGGEAEAIKTYRDVIEPLVTEYCAGCHTEGGKKGNVALDAFASDQAILANRDLWWSVLKNLRSGIMPPAGKPRPSTEQVRQVGDWVKQSVLGIDLNDPDPGRVTLRRLNRVEYRNTIRDLMGVEFNTDEEFPADDTGYGFDTIGDVLSVSPLLLEKYLQAAETIVAKGVPTVSRVVRTENFSGNQFRGDGNANGSRLSFYDKATVSRSLRIDKPGRRKLAVDLNVDGNFEFDPGLCRVVLKADDKVLLREEYRWQDNKRYWHEFDLELPVGEHRLSFELEPLTPADQKKNNILFRIVSVDVQGPLDREHWVRPPNFDRFFHADDPGTPAGRRAYAREVLRRFTLKAYRRPADDRTIDRLVTIAEETYSKPGKSVEEGLAQAMIGVLASPRFLFRIEGTVPNDGKSHPLIDEYALASRLSYFLWSTMPDEELFRLAGVGELRKNLTAQVKRMVSDDRSERMTKNFTGQWLQARDVETIPIDARTVLARDDGVEKELAAEREELRKLQAEREAAARKAAESGAKGETPKAAQAFGGFRRSGRFRRLFSPPRVDLDEPIRVAMRRETEMFFNAVVREDRSVLELLDSDFTYLNERLAKFYGLPEVKGDYMRKVSLPPDSPRGGVLTQGTVLVVTSNPTRTSPVKRGLFILDNILGTPAPPAPPAVPTLEDSELSFKDREPTLREIMEIHRQKPLCNACHSRMDPLGLALENFNAMGLWRDKERGQPLDTGGKLITGETFDDVRVLKKVLKDQHRGDFYRCLTEKLMTYALGRGPEPSDAESVDRIVSRLEEENGKFSALLMGLVESPPFQKRRQPGSGTLNSESPPPAPAGRSGGAETSTGAKP